MPVFTRNNLTQWIGAAVVGAMVTEGARFAFGLFQGWRSGATWFDPLIASLVLPLILPGIFAYVFYRRYIIDGRAEPAMMRIWFGGLTVSYLAIAYYHILTGRAEALVNSLKDDPISATSLFLAAIFGLVHSMFRAVLTGDGAERRRRRPRPAPPTPENPPP